MKSRVIIVVVKEKKCRKGNIVQNVLPSSTGAQKISLELT